jgi:anti-sigma regulatory factor (Ser/Thr protein kinase)
MDLLLKVKLPAVLDNLTQFIESVADCAREQGFEQKRVSQIELVMEEALVNIINYAYPDKNGEAEVVCGIDQEKRFVIEISDWGTPFDVLSLDEPDIVSDVSDRKVGGLGVFMIRSLTDDVKYRFEDNKNILTLFLNRK